jgi:hypothetical protein
MAPTTIRISGKRRHLDKSSPDLDEKREAFIGYFLNGARSGSGTSSAVAR